VAARHTGPAAGMWEWPRKGASALAYGRDGGLLATSTYDCAARVWDADAGRLLQTLSGHGGKLQGLAFHPDGRRLATCSSDETVRIWNVLTGDAVRELSGHRDGVWSGAISPDGRVLASGSQEGSLK